MLSRVTTRVILHSAKNCAFIGPLPSKFRALLSGTPDQQASEAIKIAVEQKPLEPETTGQIRKIISQIPHLFSDGTIPAPRMTEFTLHRFNDLAIRRIVKIEPLKGLDAKKESANPVQKSLIKDTAVSASLSN